MPQLSARTSKHAMAIMVVLYGLIAICFGERIGVNEGRGWDGCYYADIAADFYGQVFPHRLDGYRIQRIVPSAVVHYSLRLLHLPTTNLDTIIRAFQVYNLLLLVVTVYLWNGIAGRLRLRSRGTWLGFVGLMCSFSAMKMPFDYPALTDTTAFALGAAIVYAFLAGNRVMILLAAALGAFTWPTLLYLAIPLILFPRRLAQWTSLNQPAHWRLRRSCRGNGCHGAVPILYQRR